MTPKRAVSPLSPIHLLFAGSHSHSDNASSSNSPRLTPRSHDPQVSPASETVARAKNVSRDRMKQETHRLRDTVEKLQRQLDEIKRDHVRRTPRPLSTLTPRATQFVAAWESLARGQCEQRYRAEVENVKLRKMHEDQVKIAQTLERVLTKRRNSELWLSEEKSSKQSRLSASGPMDHLDALDEMDAMLPSLYAQIDTVLAKDCFSKGPGETSRNVDVRHDEATGAYVEATEKRLVPFSVQDVGDAMWEFFVCYPDYRVSAVEDSTKQGELSTNVIVKRVELRLQLPRFTGTLRMKFTARRYVHADRVVVVWIALADPSDLNNAQLDGVHIRHTGWVCARPAPVETNSNAMTEFISAQLSVPEFFEGGDRKRRLCTLTNFLVSSIHSQLDATIQSLDNRLLERSLVLLRTAAKTIH